MYETQALGGGVSSGRVHSAGGAEPPRGSEVAITSGIGEGTTGATTAEGAAPAHPMLEGQEGHDGAFPSGMVQQSALVTVRGTAATCSAPG